MQVHAYGTFLAVSYTHLDVYKRQILCFKEFQLCLELVIFYLLQLQALSFVLLLYHLITQEYIEEAAKHHTDYGGNRHTV